MTKAQWKAVYDYCRENCISKYELLAELKANGAVDRKTLLEELSDYTDDSTYDAMKRFLEDNI